MRRIHFVEIEDEPWCPLSIRDAATDYLQFAIEKVNPYEVAAGKLLEALDASGRSEIIDLCSGGGGPWNNLLPALAAARPQIKVCLTDKYPNTAAFERLQKNHPVGLSFSTEPVDATRVPARLRGFRTLFTSFHHFRPEEARKILSGAVAGGEGIAIFEFTQRKPAAVLLMLLTPLFVLLATPFIRPFRFSRVLWTYVVPAVPLLIGFDGVVSSLRTYNPSELKELAAGLSEDYRWETGELPVKGSIVPVTYLVGCLKKAARSEGE